MLYNFLNTQKNSHLFALYGLGALQMVLYRYFIIGIPMDVIPLVETLLMCFLLLVNVSTVNQAFGFTRHPGEPKDIAAIYVTDLGQPNPDNAWIDAKTAYYVIESKFVSGMKTVDSVPFSDLAKAEAFAKENGGRVIRFDEMPDEWIYK